MFVPLTCMVMFSTIQVMDGCLTVTVLGTSKLFTEWATSLGGRGHVTPAPTSADSDSALCRGRGH